MNCSNLVKCDNQDVMAHCNKWGYDLCAESVIPWHNGKSCFEDTEFRYSKVVKGKSIQLCPLWGKFIEKAKKCNHLTWQRCMSNFWMFCRNKYTKNHLNPLNNEMCSSLQKVQKTSLVSKMPTIISSKTQMFWILLLFFLLSPLFALWILPYVGYKNTINKTRRGFEKRKGFRFTRWILGIMCFLGLVLWFPFMWVFSIVWVSLIVWKYSEGVHRKTKVDISGKNRLNS